MKKLLVPLSVLALALAGCGGSDSAGADGAGGDRLSVVTTTPIIADFVRNVGGDHVEVYDVIKPGVDLHDYEPTPADINALADADVIVRNGVELETWFDTTMSAAGGNATVIDTSTNVALRHAGAGADAGEDEAQGDHEHAEEGHDHAGETAEEHAAHDHGDEDPHIWHDPANAKVMVQNIADALLAADSANADAYRANLATYDAQLDELQAYIAGQIGGLDNKKLVTNHDALGYFVDAFGLDYVGAVIPSFDSQAELSSSEIATLVSKIRDEGVKAVFSESTLPPNTAQAIASEAGVKVVEGDNALYGDSLGDAGSGAATYLEMERHNTDAIVANLR